MADMGSSLEGKGKGERGQGRGLGSLVGRYGKGLLWRSSVAAPLLAVHAERFVRERRTEREGEEEEREKKKKRKAKKRKKKL
jgi:hypothetical protein